MIYSSDFESRVVLCAWAYDVAENIADLPVSKYKLELERVDSVVLFVTLNKLDLT